jgi:hypothetical protein
MSDIHNLIDENKEYELVIGKSFQNGSKASFHLLKCMFKSIKSSSIYFYFTV